MKIVLFVIWWIVGMIGIARFMYHNGEDITNKNVVMVFFGGCFGPLSLFVDWVQHGKTKTWFKGRSDDE